MISFTHLRVNFNIPKGFVASNACSESSQTRARSFGHRIPKGTHLCGKDMVLLHMRMDHIFVHFQRRYTSAICLSRDGGKTQVRKDSCTYIDRGMSVWLSSTLALVTIVLPFE